jgi:hypothetical protein
MALLSEASELAFRAGGALVTLVGDGERRRMVEAVSLAKLGTAAPSRDLFAPIVYALEERLASHVRELTHGPLMTRAQKGWVLRGGG